jgi:hypothetical protein
VAIEDAPHDRQPQPRPLPARFGGEERFEQARAHLFRDAGPVVDHPDHHPVRHLVGLDRDLTLAIEGLNCVVDQVRPHLIELVDVYGNTRDCAVSARDRYTMRQEVVQELHRLLDSLVDVGVLSAGVLVEVRVAFEPTDDALDAADRVLDGRDAAM